VTYLRDLWWPSDLAASYPFLVHEIVVARVLPALLLLAGISAAVFVLRRSHRYLVAGWLWYLIMLAPVIGILQVGNQSRADRYTYLPQIGLLLLLTWLVSDLSAGWRYRRAFFSALGTTVLVALALSARVQAAYWRDSQSLWTHALACTSENVIAEQNLGQAVHEQGRLEEAIAHFERALEINPDQASVHSSLGVVLLETGRMRESLVHLQTALEIDPNDGDAHYNLGNTFLQNGRAGEAVAQYKRALEINPDDIETMNNLAWVLATSPDALVRDGPKAIELAERADILTRKVSPVIRATLAAAYAETGRFPEALQTAQRALQLALSEGNNARASSIRSQVEFYERDHPFRDRRFTSILP
jgi:tetratricopeptide (TPR) repeat protein